MAESRKNGGGIHGRDVKVGVVLLNYCSVGAVLKACRRYSSFDKVSAVIVVDNASPDGSWDRIMEETAGDSIPKATFFRNDHNTGYGAGNNVGIAHCLSEGVGYVLVVNPDVLLLEPQFNALVGRLRDSSLGFICPSLLLDSDPPEVDCFGGLWDTWIGRGVQHMAGASPDMLASDARWPPINSRRYWATPSGACVLFKTEAISALGMLPEDTFLFGEEVLLAAKARRLGMRYEVDPLIHAIHLRGLTTGSSRKAESRSLSALFHSSRSSLITSISIWPRRRLIYLTCRLVWATMLGVKGHPSAARQIVYGSFSGMRDGRRATYLK